MNVIVKMDQSLTMYIAEYTNVRKLTCLTSDNLYMMPESFIGPTFNDWTTLIDIEKIENYLKFDEKWRLCMAVCGYVFLFHYVSKMGQTSKEFRVSRDQFNDIVISVRHNLIQIAQSISKELRERFPRDELLESISVGIPSIYWNIEKEIDSLKVDFLSKFNILVHHFGRHVKVQGEEIGGILDSSKLYQQAFCFTHAMSNQFHVLVKPIEYGTVIKLWTILGESHYLQENMLEYLKLVDLCQTTILRSMENGRMFSAP